MICVACTGGAALNAASAAETGPAFTVGSPRRADTLYEREYVSEIRAMRYAEIRSRLKGVIDSVAVDEGEAAKAEQVLFTINPREAQQELQRTRAMTRSAKAELRLAQLEHQNTQLLFEKNVVSSAELALAIAKVEALEAKLEEAKAGENRAAIELSYTRLRAPFAGLVHRIPRKAGSVVDEGELLTTLADTSEIYAYFRVSEREYLEYTRSAPGDRPHQASLKLADGIIHPAQGVIDAIASEVERDTGNLAFRARFPNPDGRLKHGSTGSVLIANTVHDALLVPQRSTFEVQGNLYVYVVDADNRARARNIVPSLRVKDEFVVTSGLSAEDRVILEGVQKVQDGAQIAIAPSS